MWEYAIVFENDQEWVCNGDSFPEPIYQFLDALNAAGQRGWELVAINSAGRYVLKRPAKEKASGKRATSF